jgi:hypothetical protein
MDHLQLVNAAMVRIPTQVASANEIRTAATHREMFLCSDIFGRIRTVKPSRLTP